MKGIFQISSCIVLINHCKWPCLSFFGIFCGVPFYLRYCLQTNPPSKFHLKRLIRECKIPSKTAINFYAEITRISYFHFRQSVIFFKGLFHLKIYDTRLLSHFFMSQRKLVSLRQGHLQWLINTMQLEI